MGAPFSPDPPTPTTPGPVAHPEVPFRPRDNGPRLRSVRRNTAHPHAISWATRGGAMSHTAHAPLLTLCSSVRTPPSQPVPSAVTVSPLSLEERRAVLDAEVS